MVDVGAALGWSHSSVTSLVWEDTVATPVPQTTKSDDVEVAARDNPSRLPRPRISFSADEQQLTIQNNGTTMRIVRPVAAPWDFNVSGSTFWVSPGGDDNSIGTERDKPMRTLEAAVNRTEPGRGDVYLLPGDTSRR